MGYVLVATDLSARSLRAVERGFRIAAARALPLRLLSVIDDDIPETLAGGLAAEVETLIADQAAALSARYPARYTVRTLRGDPAEVLREAVARGPVELVVMGLHRERSFMETIHETTLERTVRASRTPVLVAVSPVDDDYSRVLAPIDFSAASAAAVAAARRFAPQAEVHLVHAYHAIHTRHGSRDGDNAPFLAEARGEHAAWASMHPELDGLPPPAFREGGLERVFQAELARVKPDLVAVGAHSRPRLATMLIGSFARRLLRDPPADLLIGHP